MRLPLQRRPTEGSRSSSQPADFDAPFRGEPRNELDDAIERRCSIIRDVERNLHAIVSARERQRAKRAQAAVALANGQGNRSRRREIGTRQFDVKRDQDVARADRDRAGAGVAAADRLRRAASRGFAVSPEASGARAVERPRRNRRRECRSASRSRRRRDAPARPRPRASRPAAERTEARRARRSADGLLDARAGRFVRAPRPPARPRRRRPVLASPTIVRTLR